MSSGPTAESLHFWSACLSSKSEKGWLYSSVLSDLNFTGFFLFLHFNGLKFWRIVLWWGIVRNDRGQQICNLFIFSPFIFLIAFQTVLGLVFDVSEEQKLCHDVSFWVLIICVALAFSCLKASTFSAEGFQKSSPDVILCGWLGWKHQLTNYFSEKFLLSFLTFFNSLFTNIVKPRHFREFVFRNAGFWNSFVCNLSQSICKLSHWILRQGQLIRQPRHTQSVEWHPVSPVKFPVLSSRFIISKRSF